MGLLRPPRGGRLPRRLAKALPYLLLSPALAYIGILLLYPIAQAVLTSFTSTQLLSGTRPAWTGFANYGRMLFKDPTFWLSMRVTVVYTVLVATSVIATGLLIAGLMNTAFAGRGLARAVITLPWAFPEVAAVLVWLWILNVNFGVMNVFARWLPGVTHNVPWLTKPDLALLSVVTVTLWKIFPFYGLVLLTALQTIEVSLYEAARIDGAGPVQLFRNVTLPGLAPTLSILLLLVTIWSFRRFTLIYLMTGGGPAGATETLVIKTYNTAFRFYDLSYGATLGVAGLVVSVLMATGYFMLRRRLGLEGAQ